MHKTPSLIPKIRVIIRKRPLSKKQISRGEKDILQISNNQTVLVKQEKVKVDLTPYTDEYKFIFDGAFKEDSTNEQIYFTTIRPLIDAAYDGARVSCFAYGQTGSGKTYTMLGDGNNIKGLYLLAAKDVFQMKNQFQDVTVWVSFYEIYCGKLYDLLNQRSILYAREDAKNNINIVGLSQRKAQSISEVMNTIQFGTSIRVTSQNSTNVDSSRSHAILQINLKKNKKLHGKISFIDLAGSQRAADHADQTDKQTRIDGAQINKSLLALKQCIRALDQNKQHTPFRGSKLTMVLKDSFTGYCKTVMIGNISPNSSSCENTLNTLKYADRVKQLKKSSNREVPQGGYLNDLSKQLMLPRQLVNHHHVVKQQKVDQSHSYSDSNQMKNNFFKESNSNIKLNHSKEDQFQYRQIRSVSSNNNSWENNEDQRDRKYSQINLQGNYSTKVFNSKTNIYSPSKNISQNDLKVIPQVYQEKQDQIYDRLVTRHEEMMSKVIQGQESLLIQHENYINASVESARQHIQLMNQADQTGTSIQGYLSKLDITLQKQIDQIYKLKALLENLKYNLDESKKIQTLYLDVNRHKSNNQLRSQKNAQIAEIRPQITAEIRPKITAERRPHTNSQLRELPTTHFSYEQGYNINDQNGYQFQSQNQSNDDEDLLFD